MKLLSIKVEHFRCIRSAKIELADGLNVLHGPNDLGKSSLAHAIRAALLLQSTATEHKTFVSWQASGEPYVELVFESEPQRIWRVRKTFGTNNAFLDWSRDGVDFALEARGRQVDERLSEILRWGVAPPGGKGRRQGMPMTFLTTALLAEQDRVSAIFTQALADDSDESGKKQLLMALQALAEDPLFKTVLALVQERVDRVFNVSDGKATKKRGKNSPWVKLSEEIQRKFQYSHDCGQELQKTAAIEMEIQQLRERQLELREIANRAQELVEALRADLGNVERRQEISASLEECKKRLEAIRGEQQKVSDAERVYAEGIREIAVLTKRRDEAQGGYQAAAELAQQAKEELARQQSEDHVRERQVKQRTVEARRAILESELLRHQNTLGSIRAIETFEAKVGAMEAELGALERGAAELEAKRAAAEKARAKVDQEESEFRGIRSMLRWQTARDELQQAEKGLAQLAEWRKQADEKKAAAAVLASAQPQFELPSRAQLEGLRRLENDRRVAAAKLDVGLSVTLRPKREMHVSVKRDDEQPARQALSGAALEIGAQRRLQLDIDGVGEIIIQGGAVDAREAAEALERRWAAEAEPLLQRAGVETLEALESIETDAAQRRTQIDASVRDAAQLEQRIADQPDWSSMRAERRQQLRLAEKALGGADQPTVQKAAQRLHITDAAGAEKRLEAIRAKLDALNSDERERAGQIAAAGARVVEKRQALEEARTDRDRARSQVEGDWQDVQRRVLKEQTQAQKELAGLEQDLKRLQTTADEGVAQAQKVLETSLQKLNESDSAYQKAQERLTEATLRQANHEGVLKTLRESTARLDERAANTAVSEVEAQLRAAPSPAQTVSEEIFTEAVRRAEAAVREADDIDGKVREKRGALQQVGGEVARQRAEDAVNDLAAAKERAHQAEIEYEAWELLRKTLREAEQEEGTHLGHVLAEPVAKRFTALTTGRYGKLDLGPDLRTGGISVAGENRLVDLLSVGTRDQLSTVFRLTLAEQLKTAVILDDQLTQSDEERMSLVRGLLAEIADNIQVIVFTCRPETYLPTIGRGRAKRDDAGMRVRTVNLTQFIERCSKATASEV